MPPMTKSMRKFLHKSVCGWQVIQWLGLLVFLYFGAQSASGIYYGIAKGRDTLSWPSTSAQVGLVRRFEDPGHPSYERMEWIAYYQVDGKTYNPANNSARINIQGNLVFQGPKAERTRAVLRSMNPAPIYYNPDDPSEAVLEPGITFSPHTWTRIYGAVFGLVVTAFGYWGRVRALRRARRGA